MIPVPDELDMSDVGERAIATLWPHITNEYRYHAVSDISAGEYYAGLAICIAGCYSNGYRIPEDYLQEIDQFVDDLYFPGLEDGGPDYWLNKIYIEQVRSLDDKTTDAEAEES